MKINDQKTVNRWNSVMNNIGCEYLTIGTRLSELENHKTYYRIENGISIDWMVEEVKYWLSCYYETGNVRCDDRFINNDNYKIWVSETGKLKRLIHKLKNLQYNSSEDYIIVEW